MGRRTLSPTSFGRAAAAWDEEFFKIRVFNAGDPARLRAAIEHEAEREGETRKDRIAAINKRLATLEDADT